MSHPYLACGVPAPRIGKHRQLYTQSPKIYKIDKDWLNWGLRCVWRDSHYETRRAPHFIMSSFVYFALFVFMVVVVMAGFVVISRFAGAIQQEQVQL